MRQLAADLGLAVGTVARAYRELELAGLVLARRGGGIRVADGGRVEPGAERIRLLDEQAAAYLAFAERVGATQEEALAAVGRAAGRGVFGT
ncbi:hypothetical protein GCM10010399_67970 [Dactylosporangium fulvum]|uniref:GntR family transcriptional regulator n=1 Tax=Dactylosporangium fulvum TaxID=53359 RepID=UPI0029D41339|nr:hypothetical protein [Dactylosporangium fulvum]